LEVVASDGSEMGARKPVIYLFNICICVCVGNPALQIYTPRFSGLFVVLEELLKI
jgi:hypothetical protein